MHVFQTVERKWEVVVKNSLFSFSAHQSHQGSQSILEIGLFPDKVTKRQQGGEMEGARAREGEEWRMDERRRKKEREVSMVRERKKDGGSEMLVFAYWQAPISCRDLLIEGVQCFVTIEGRLELCSAVGLKPAEWLCWSAIPHVEQVWDLKKKNVCVINVFKMSSVQFVKH